MEVNIVKGQLVIRHRLKGEMYKVSSGENFKTVSIFRKPQVVAGFTSLCEDFKHVLLVDYDETWRDVVEYELKQILENFQITPFYLFTTKEEKENGFIIGNYHAVSLAKLRRPQVAYILKEWTSCDRRYVDMWCRSKFKSWVLRQTAKVGSGRPKFLKLVGDTASLPEVEVSLAHKKELETIFPHIPKLKYPLPDGFKKVFMNIYETR